MNWNRMTTPQRAYAGRIADRLDRHVTVSQVAKYLDDFAAWDRGEITAAELAARTGHDLTKR